jgi:hypothetical protein
MLPRFSFLRGLILNGGVADSALSCPQINARAQGAWRRMAPRALAPSEPSHVSDFTYRYFSCFPPGRDKVGSELASALFSSQHVAFLLRSSSM